MVPNNDKLSSNSIVKVLKLISKNINKKTDNKQIKMITVDKKQTTQTHT